MVPSILLHKLFVCRDLLCRGLAKPASTSRTGSQSYSRYQAWNDEEQTVLCDWPPAANNSTKLDPENVNMCDSPPPFMTRNTKASGPSATSNLDSYFSFVDFSGNSISRCRLLLCSSCKAFIQIQAEDKSAFKLSSDRQAVQPNWLNGAFFLDLHRIGCTVFLILCLLKLTWIHEDSNIYIEERRCSTSDKSRD